MDFPFKHERLYDLAFLGDQLEKRAMLDALTCMDKRVRCVMHEVEVAQLDAVMQFVGTEVLESFGLEQLCECVVCDVVDGVEVFLFGDVPENA